MSGVGPNFDAGYTSGLPNEVQRQRGGHQCQHQNRTTRWPGLCRDGDRSSNGLESNRDLLGDLVDALLPDVVYRPRRRLISLGSTSARMARRSPLPTCSRTPTSPLTEDSLFRGDGQGHARLNFATQPEILTEIVERTGSVL